MNEVKLKVKKQKKEDYEESCKEETSMESVAIGLMKEIERIRSERELMGSDMKQDIVGPVVKLWAEIGIKVAKVKQLMGRRNEYIMKIQRIKAMKKEIEANVDEKKRTGLLSRVIQFLNIK